MLLLQPQIRFFKTDRVEPPRLRQSGGNFYCEFAGLFSADFAQHKQNDQNKNRRAGFRPRHRVAIKFLQHRHGAGRQHQGDKQQPNRNETEQRR